MDKTFYKSRLRNKGQITVPQEIRAVLGAEEGDDLVFYTDQHGQIVISRAQIIPPDQTWFWSERWQKMEKAAQADLDHGRAVEYKSAEEALAGLNQLEGNDDA